MHRGMAGIHHGIASYRPDYIELPDAYQTAALRGILTGKYRDHIDMKMAEREYGKDELLNEVRRYAAI